MLSEGCFWLIGDRSRIFTWVESVTLLGLSVKSGSDH